ncbi:MAG: radical SAM protein [Deltaproteobacteria bacterium]|nr:radical SAM protein [Deltaproteobacteria bacterium]
MASAKLWERALVGGAKLSWSVFQAFNRLFKDGKSISPAWAPGPLLKSYERTRPNLGFPRQTDSLCPQCVKEVRSDIIEGRTDHQVLIEGNPGEIKAEIVERDGEIWMVKDCPKHGHYEDKMAMDADFLNRIEKLFPGRDFKSPKTSVRNHGTSTIRYGRGSVLTVDLTNRCNMMCDPCFMDANQVGYVHELSFDEVKEILDNSLKIKPRRQMSVQFSGGEPTLSPHFIPAIKYAKEVGYFSVQCATNGIRFAESEEFAQEAADAGLRFVYLQFDGVGNENNEHRKIGNLFDVKLRAMENLYKAGIDIVLVVTIVNTVNNHQIGPIIKFAIENSDKISFISFQPVSFTGRDEDISDEDRHRQRYTMSHLAHDVKKQTGLSEPLRDWFPLSVGSVFANLADLANPDPDWGNMSCGCHPNCGVGMILMVNKKTKVYKPLSEFINLEHFLKDVDRINDAARGKFLTKLQIAMSFLRNVQLDHFPEGLRLKDLIVKFDKQSGGTLSNKDYGTGHERKKDEWLFMFVAGMWFQDLFNYDFRRTEMCIIPYGTQEGEISFCAYNTGVGWRNIIENMYKNASVGSWYKKHGRHKVYAGGARVELETFENTLRVKEEMMVAKEAAIKAKEALEKKPNANKEELKEEVAA